MKLLYYALKYQGEYEKIKRAIQNNEVYQEVEYFGDYVTILDEHYPTLLRQLDNPPFVLFYKGDLNLLKDDLICVVGSRNVSNEAKLLVQELKNLEIMFISGLAKGVDSFVHLYCENSIGVIGCGIDRIYPLCNQDLYTKTKLIISEYPGMTLPLKHHFPMRNRIMVALCKKLVVVEAKLPSGTLRSVEHALALGKEVFVFPKSYFSEYSLNNQLIKEGANIIVDIEDLL